MKHEIFTCIIGGKAGEGVKKAGSVAAHIFSRLGRHVFQYDDYQSLIRGGHNFAVVSSAPDGIGSSHMKANLVIAFDSRSYENHRNHLIPGGIMVFNSDVVKDGEGIGIPMTKIARKYPRSELRIGVSAAAILAATLGFDSAALEELITREYHRDSENNLAFAKEIYELAISRAGGEFKLSRGDRQRPIISGNEAIALGAVAGGLDIYVAYPMTPSSSLLHYLASWSRDFKVTVMHPESEIAVANIAIGATYAGARTMVGSSGGGFALMEEAFSLAGMVESPLMCVLSSRPGPSTGVPTYSSQGDLRFALNQGHGEFPRIVASPGSLEEAFYLTSELLNLAWKFQTPVILLTEKHLSEGSATVDIDVRKAIEAKAEIHSGGEYRRYLDTPSGVSPLHFQPSHELIKWNSYEHDELGITTEAPADIVKMNDKRAKKTESIKNYLKTMRTVNVFGDSGPLIYTYGSTTMSVREALALSGIAARVVQPVYLEPFPIWEFNRFGNEPAIVVEMSSTGQFAQLLKEKACIEPMAVIRQYDGRPFEPEELGYKINDALTLKAPSHR